MTALLFLVGFFGTLACFYHRVKLWQYALGGVVFWGVFYTLSGIGFLSTLTFLIWAGVTGLLSLTTVRKQFLTAPIFKWFQSIMPPMSETERAAIQAGDIWWEAELFRGKPEWQTLLKYPKVSLTTEEQSFVDNEVEALCEIVDDWTINQMNDLPEPVWQFIKDKKFFGMIIPKEFGGHGFSAAAHSAVVSKLASRSVAAAVTVMVPNSLGPAELLMRYGNASQKEYYLPRLAKGDEIPCFALTGPEAGSDAGSMPDYGIVTKAVIDGKETLGIRLTFSKRYITLAPVATVVGLAFKLYDPKGLLGGEEDRGITLCLIPRDTKGLEIGNRHLPMQTPFMNGTVRANDMFVPMDTVIGGMERVGQGWHMLMECLSEGRGISLPALSTASAQLSLKTTGAYSAVREQFNLPIGRFEGVGEVLGAITGITYQAEAARQLTVAAIDQHIKPSVVSAIAKYHMTEMARKVLNHAMDVHAGKAIIAGPNNYLAGAYQALPICITVEGANILTRNLIVFGQGAIRCHPYLKDEIEAVGLARTDASRALAQFDKALWAHIGFAIGNGLRSFVLGWTRAYGSVAQVMPGFNREVQQLNWLSSALATTTEFSFLTLGGQLKRKEQLSARLGDILSHLYLASAAIKYYADHGQSAQEVPLLRWTLQDNLYQGQQALIALLDNFPSKVVGRVLKGILLPFGAVAKPPSDALTQSLATFSMQPSELRERLTQLCYVGEGMHEPVALLEMALKLKIALAPMLKKVQSAFKAGELSMGTGPFEQKQVMQAALDKGLISNDDMANWLEYEQARQLVVAVDEFSPDELAGVEKSWQKTANTQTG